MGLIIVALQECWWPLALESVPGFHGRAAYSQRLGCVLIKVAGRGDGRRVHHPRGCLSDCGDAGGARLLPTL